MWEWSHTFTQTIYSQIKSSKTTNNHISSNFTKFHLNFTETRKALTARSSCDLTLSRPLVGLVVLLFLLCICCLVEHCVGSTTLSQAHTHRYKYLFKSKTPPDTIAYTQDLCECTIGKIRRLKLGVLWMRIVVACDLSLRHDIFDIILFDRDHPLSFNVKLSFRLI